MKKGFLILIGLLVILTAFSYSRFGAKDEYLDTLKERYDAFWTSVNDLAVYIEDNQLAVPELISDLKKTVVQYSFEGKTQDVDTYEKQWLSFYERFDQLATLAIDHKAAAEDILRKMEDILLEYIPEVRTLGIDPVKLAEYGIEMKRIDGATFQMPVSDDQDAEVKVSTFYSAVYPVNAYVYLHFLDYLYSMDMIKERSSSYGGRFYLKNGNTICFSSAFDVYRGYIQLKGKKLYLDKDQQALKNMIITFYANYTSNINQLDFMNWLSDQFGLVHAYKKGSHSDETNSVTENITRVNGFRLPTEVEWWSMFVGNGYRKYIYGNKSKSISESDRLNKKNTAVFLKSGKGIYFPNYNVREIMYSSIDIEKFDEREGLLYNPINQGYLCQRSGSSLELFKQKSWNSSSNYFFRPVLSLQNLK